MVLCRVSRDRATQDTGSSVWHVAGQAPPTHPRLRTWREARPQDRLGHFVNDRVMRSTSHHAHDSTSQQRLHNPFEVLNPSNNNLGATTVRPGSESHTPGFLPHPFPRYIVIIKPQFCGAAGQRKTQRGADRTLSPPATPSPPSGVGGRHLAVGSRHLPLSRRRRSLLVARPAEDSPPRRQNWGTLSLSIYI